MIEYSTVKKAVAAAVLSLVPVVCVERRVSRSKSVYIVYDKHETDKMLSLGFLFTFAYEQSYCFE